MDKDVLCSICNEHIAQYKRFPQSSLSYCLSCIPEE